MRPSDNERHHVLPARVQETADALLRPLRRRFRIVEVFWEDRWRVVVPLGAPGEARATITFSRGVHLRGVGETEARSAWTSDVSPRGLRAASADLGITVGSLPEREAGSNVGPADVVAWRAASLALYDAARARLGRPIRGALTWETTVRSVAWAPARGCRWAVDRGFVVATCGDGRGGRVERSRLVDAPARLAGCGLVEDLAQAVERPSGVRAPAGAMPVVFAPGLGGVFFHEVVGHALEADHVLRGQSPFARYALGDTVASAELSVVDRAEAAWGAGAISVDDEGQSPRAVTLIDRGRLAGLLHDRVTAAVQGRRPTGNGRRASFRLLPEPRMRNLVVCAGPHEPDALLSGIRRGLYVERADGRNDLATGRFSLAVSAGRAIEHRRLGPPVRSAVVRGELRAALGAITGIGRDVVVSDEPIACAKRGTLDTGLAAPTVRVERLAVLA